MDAIDRQSITELNVSDPLPLAALAAMSVARTFADRLRLWIELGCHVHRHRRLPGVFGKPSQRAGAKTGQTGAWRFLKRHQNCDH
jgi:hypothetical protein